MQTRLNCKWIEPALTNLAIPYTNATSDAAGLSARALFLFLCPGIPLLLLTVINSPVSSFTFLFSFFDSLGFFSGLLSVSDCQVDLPLALYCRRLFLVSRRGFSRHWARRTPPWRFPRPIALLFCWWSIRLFSCWNSSLVCIISLLLEDSCWQARLFRPFARPRRRLLSYGMPLISTKYTKKRKRTRLIQSS